MEWHYAYNVNARPVDDSAGGHGSCVASKAAGWKNGVSKNSQIVMLKTSMTIADENWAFAKALDDIIEKDRQGKAVVIYPRLSLSTNPGMELSANWESIRQIMQDLFSADVVVVTCAGNEALKRSSVITQLPALWASNDFPLLVDGAVAPIGEYAKFSQGSISSRNVVWAPGDRVVCARGIYSPSPPYERIGRGTSLSAGMVRIPALVVDKWANKDKVAGLVAYFIGRLECPGQVAETMRKKLLGVWSRPISPRSSPNVIWNGQDGSNFQGSNKIAFEMGYSNLSIMLNGTTGAPEDFQS